MQLTPFIHIDDFQYIRINGPFELTHLSPHMCQLTGQGFTIIIESLEALVTSMNVEEVTINIEGLTRLELRKMDMV